MLKDVNGKYGVAAVVQLCGSCEYPPTISQIREMALNLSGGRVTPPSPWEAWENVVNGKELSGIEKRALSIIGGNFAVKRSTNIGVERSNFVKAYADLLNTDRRMKLAIPEVKQLVSENTPDITQPGCQIEEKEEINRPTPEELKELLSGLVTKVKP